MISLQYIYSNCCVGTLSFILVLIWVCFSCFSLCFLIHVWGSIKPVWHTGLKSQVAHPLLFFLYQTPEPEKYMKRTISRWLRKVNHTEKLTICSPSLPEWQYVAIYGVQSLFLSLEAQNYIISRSILGVQLAITVSVMYTCIINMLIVWSTIY